MKAIRVFIKILKIKVKRPSVGILGPSVQLGVGLLTVHFKDVTLEQFLYKPVFLGWIASWIGLLPVSEKCLCWYLLNLWVILWELKEIGYYDFSVNSETSNQEECHPYCICILQLRACEVFLQMLSYGGSHPGGRMVNVISHHTWERDCKRMSGVPEIKQLVFKITWPVWGRGRSLPQIISNLRERPQITPSSHLTSVLFLLLSLLLIYNWISFRRYEK